MKKLMKIAIKEYCWYIHNISTDCVKALAFSQLVFEHALFNGSITELQYKKLCLTLPFETYLK